VFCLSRCGACQQFERSYNLVAKNLQDEDVKVGKVDIDQNQALASRFGIHHLPTVFLVKDGDVYLYEGSRSYEDVVAFAQGKYRDAEPIPYWSSPMGPVGYFKGLLTRTGIALVNMQPLIMETFGVSRFVSYAISALLAGIALCVLIFLAVCIHITHEKNE
jgi:thiol-disulfide isomerase/thioredoxin